MMLNINSISNKSILRPQTQSLGLQKIVSQINANAANKRNFDIVKLSKKAQAFLEAGNQTKEAKKEPVINYEHSDMVTSERWGNRSKADFAEMSLSAQRNDLKTFSDKVDYHKAKLKFTMGKISELEDFLNGTGAHSDPNMTRETAETYLRNYKQSIVDDYANFTMGRSQYHADEFDKLSDGLASKVFENPLHSLNAETLGLANLPSDPNEIMKALENASQMLNEMTARLESAFTEATGGQGFTEPAKSWSIFDGNSSLDFFASQMEKPPLRSVSVEGSHLSGEVINIGG